VKLSFLDQILPKKLLRFWKRFSLIFPSTKKGLESLAKEPGKKKEKEQKISPGI